jgi:membrane associated rhomboid family serine protease
MQDMVNTMRAQFRAPIMVYALAALIAAAYLGFVLSPESVKDFLYFHFALIPARFDPAHPAHFTSWWEALGPLFGHVFLHGGWLHLGMNALVLLQGGPLVESRVGGFRFLLIFFISALGGALMFLLVNLGSEEPAIGASGAICGIFAAYFLAVRPTIAMALKDRRVQQGIFWFLAINVVLAAGARYSGVLPIAWEAHLGGFLGGALAFVLLAPRLKPGPWDSFA